MMTREELMGDQMKTLRILAFTIIGGIVVFCCIAVLVHFSRGPLLQGFASKNLLFGILLLITLGFLFYARYLYRVRYQELVSRRTESFEFEDLLTVRSGVFDRVNDYRTTMTLHFVLCEIPGLIAMVCFLLFGDYNFFLVPVMSLIEMIRKFPTKARLARVVGNLF